MKRILTLVAVLASVAAVAAPIAAAKTVPYQFRGDVVSFTGSTITLTVKSGTKYAVPFVGETLTFTVGGIVTGNTSRSKATVWIQAPVETTVAGIESHPAWMVSFPPH